MPPIFFSFLTSIFFHTYSKTPEYLNVAQNCFEISAFRGIGKRKSPIQKGIQCKKLRSFSQPKKSPSLTETWLLHTSRLKRLSLNKSRPTIHVKGHITKNMAFFLHGTSFLRKAPSPFQDQVWEGPMSTCWGRGLLCLHFLILHTQAPLTCKEERKTLNHTR